MAFEVREIERAVLDADAVVAVGVEVGDDDEAHAIEDALAEWGEREIAAESEHLFFALDFAGVDVRLDHDDDLLLAARELGGERAARGEHERHDVLSLAALAYRSAMNQRALFGDLVAKRDDLGVARRLGVVGELGARTRQNDLLRRFHVGPWACAAFRRSNSFRIKTSSRLLWPATDVFSAARRKRYGITARTGP